MRAVRITKRKHAQTAWSGYGAQQFGGRWNSVGYKAVYCASSASLAVLEVLVHLAQPDLLEHYLLLEVDVPDEAVAMLDPDDLPADWADSPAPASTQRIGDEWLLGGETLGLLVPSVVVPSEQNLLLNPAHPAFAAVLNTARETPYRFDPRLR